MLQKITGSIRRAVEDYNMIQEGDKIAVALSGGKDSITLLYGLHTLRRFYPIHFDIMAITIHPDSDTFHTDELEKMCKDLSVEYVIYHSDLSNILFDVRKEKNPCSLCANLRRGIINSIAIEQGCNKIALGHHFDDVIETTLLNMFQVAKIETMLPKLHSDNFTGMQLIRPLYLVREKDIIAWKNYNNLSFLQCACRFTEKAAIDENSSKKKHHLNHIEGSDGALFF